MRKLKIFKKENFKILLIFVCVFSVYLNSLPNPFIRDDIHLIVENPYIKNFKNFPFWFKTDLFRGGTSNFYRPFQTFLYSIIYHLFGLKVFPYHLLNILLHFLNCVLIYIFLKEIYEEEISFWVTILFTVHPANTQAITYISGTADPLFLFFGLLSLLFFLKNKFLFSYLFFIFSILSKEASLMFLFLIFIANYLLLSEKERKKFYLCIPYILISLIYIFLRMTALNFLQFPSVPFKERFFTSFKAFLLYIQLTFFPAYLSVDRNILFIKTWKNPFFILGFFLFIFSIFLIIYYRRDGKKIFPGIWFLINFIFVSNIFVKLNANFSEHWIYPGLPMLLLYFITGIKKILKKYSLHFLLIVSILFGMRTILRNFDWKSPEKIYKKAIEKIDSWALHHNLGIEYLNRGDYEKAKEEFEKALTLKKNLVNTYIGLGFVYVKMGDDKKALQFYQKALELQPDYGPALIGIARIYIRNNKIDRAIEILKRSIEKNPAFSPAYSLLASILKEKGDLKSAIKYYEKALAINPDKDEIHEELGIYYFSTGEIKKAEEHFLKAYNLKPDKIEYILNLAFFYRNTGKIDYAINYYLKADKIKRDDPVILNDLAVCYAQKGEIEKARKIWMEILKKYPDFAPARENLFN